jgi:hypothetical protein
VRTTRIKTAVAAAAVTTAFGLLGSPLAMADDTTATTIGQQARLSDGGVVQGWTITGLKPSSDVIPYSAHGTLWEATATSEAIQGSVQPFVSNLNARAGDGDNYRVLFGVATPQGINPAGLAQGEKATGKVYFDVTDANPDRVVYNDGGQDLLVWNPAPAELPASGGSGSWTPRSTGGSQSAPAPAATTPAPATGSTGTPITEGTPATPAPAAATPAPAPAAGSAGTPITEGTPVAPAPAAGTPAPAGGSAGTPAGEVAPIPTEVPHGAQYAPAS